MENPIVKPGHRLPAGVGLYAQVRASSVPKYPLLEWDRWYPIRQQENLGCFIQVGGGEVFLKRGHYLCRQGRRGSDKPLEAGAESPTLPG